MLKRYRFEINVEKDDRSNDQVNYLNFAFIIGTNNRLCTKFYNTRCKFKFHIVNFLSLLSNIPSGPSYGVYILQLIRCARCYDDIVHRHKLPVNKLLSQGYEVNQHRNAFQKEHGGYFFQDICLQYLVTFRATWL